MQVQRYAYWSNIHATLTRKTDEEIYVVKESFFVGRTEGAQLPQDPPEVWLRTVRLQAGASSGGAVPSPGSTATETATTKKTLPGRGFAGA